MIILRAASAMCLLFAGNSVGLSQTPEQAYEKGYQSGYQKGLQEGRAGIITILSRGGPVRIPGTTVGTVFMPVPETLFETQPMQDLVKQIERFESGDSVLLQGKDFNTWLDATKDGSLKLPSDSSIAIIPNQTLDELMKKPGSDLIKEGLILKDKAKP